MYDWPEVAWAHDALWTAIAERLNEAGIVAPDKLARGAPPDDVWTSPGLLFSQTCGFPFATRLRGAVQLVAVPVYSAEGCDRTRYSSALVVRKDEPARRLADFRGRRFALNSRDSLSGYVALADHARAHGLDVGDVAWLETGGHRASLAAVAEGRADLAAIDAVCLALAKAHEAPTVGRLRVLERTRGRSALPYVTAVGRPRGEVETIRSALFAALAAPETSDARAALRLAGAEAVGDADYLDGLHLPR